MRQLRRASVQHNAIRQFAVFACASLLVCLPMRAAWGRGQERLDYNRDIRPILAENCLACHGFSEEGRAADLRLDVAESAYEDRGGYAAVVPGQVAASELWRRINSDDEAERMPPPDSHQRLSVEQTELLRLWIEQGAPYARHWSFVKPTKVPLPQVAATSWPRHEIDQFVLARLENEQLQPAEQADRGTLIRRLSLDLTGLPPGAEEAQNFVTDPRPDAYEQLVDRLLDSPHFGERFALDWLDAARYADTNGFSIDGGRHIWLWRDWVIDAFNQNLPYDQFLRDQLAGDQLPARTAAQLIATGLQRNNMVTHEGGTIPEENLVNYNADRVKTLGEAMLGLTLGCAQCHDHKYDPITQRDYYRLFAYFNTASDVGLDGNGGVNPKPSYISRTVLQSGDTAAIKEQIEQIKSQLSHPDPVAQARWEAAELQALRRRGQGLELHPTRLLKISTPNRGDGFEVDADRYVNITQRAGRLAYDLSMKLPPLTEPVTGFRAVFHPAENTPAHGWGFGKLESDVAVASGAQSVADKGTFVVTSFSASAEPVPGDQVNLHKLLPFRQVTASSFRPNHRPEYVGDTRDHNGWSPRLDESGSVHLTLTLAEPLDAAAAPYLTAQVNFGYGDNLAASRFEVMAITGTDDGTLLPDDVVMILQTPPERRTPAEAARLTGYFADYGQATESLRIELTNLTERLQVLTAEYPTMVMDLAAQPRQTYVLTRGSYAQPGEPVTAGTPAFLPTWSDPSADDRLSLAAWITMPDQPLTARVAVNRFWKLLFGAGIVRTAADFGSQGEWPTHPELLDWLAVDFVEGGWNVKALVRKIVTSATYRQSSIASADLRARDPANRLLARGPRFRLPAELIRDVALQTSGLLVPWIGGPSVNPYTPGDLWREVSHYGSSPATAQTFVQDHGSKLYRRSLYTYWKRTVPPPNMVVFDAPNRETCVVQRGVTTTPLQALVMLNDVQFVECARAFAERAIASASDDADRLQWACRECLSRPANDKELAVLSQALQRERRRYAADPVAAARLLANGESRRNEELAVVEHAAWSQVAALLLNLSETVTRN